MSEYESLVEQMCDTIDMLLGQAQKSDTKTGLILIIQTGSFFREIIDSIMGDSQYIHRIEKTVSLFFRSVKEYLPYFLEDADSLQSLSDLLVFLVGCHLRNDISLEISSFIANFLFSNFYTIENSKYFYPLLEMFFCFPDLAQSFESSGGMYAIWDLYKEPIKYSKFNFISQSSHKYLQSKNISDSMPFVTYVSESIKEIHPDCAYQAFSFLHTVFSNSACDIVTPFAKHGGFREINQYIISHDQESLILIYHLFRSLIQPISSSDYPPILTALIEISSYVGILEAVQTITIQIIASALKEFTPENSPIQPQDIYEMADAIDSGPSTGALYDLSLFLSTELGLNAVSTFTALTKIWKTEFALKSDLSSIFKLLRLFWNELHVFAPTFLAQIIDNTDNRSFGELLSKYEDLFKCISLFIGSDADADDKLMVMNAVVIAGEFLRDNQQFMAVIGDCILVDELRISLIQKTLELRGNYNLINLIFESVCNCINSSYLRKKFIDFSILEIAAANVNRGDLSTETAFKLCSVLSGGKFSPEFDKKVSDFVFESGLSSAPAHLFRELAFSVGCNGQKRLAFPSLLAFCGDFSIDSPYDLWIAGRYGIKTWMEKTTESIDKFPQIEKVSRRYLLPEHARMILEYPSLVRKCVSDSFGLIPLFEFQKGSKNSELTLKTGLTKTGGFTFSFWFFAKTFAPKIQTIVRIHNTSLYFTGDELFFADKIIGEIQINRWYSVTISMGGPQKLSLTQQKTVLYLDGKNVLTVGCSFDPTIVIGPGQAEATWFIGGAMRVVDSSVSDEMATTIFRAGVPTIRPFIPNEKMTVSADAFSERLEGILDPSLEGTLSEFSCPVPSYPLLRHIARTYDGGDGMFCRIIRETRAENAKTLLLALVSLHKARCSNWTNEEFALHISALHHINSRLIDQEVVADIMAVFSDESKDTMDWSSLLTMLLDPMLFNGSRATDLVSQVFGFIVQYPLDDQSLVDFIFVFVFFALQTCQGDNETIVALLSRLRPSVFTLTSCLCSMANYEKNLRCPTMKYEPITKSDHYREFVDILKNLISADFSFIRLLRILTPDDALELAFEYFKQTKMESVSEKGFLIRMCMDMVNLPLAWSVALSLLTHSIIDVTVTMDFECTKLDASVLPDFLTMVSILLSASYSLSNESFYAQLLGHVLEFLKDVSEALPLKSIDDRIIFAISNLLACGLYCDRMAFYPFSPSEDDIDELIARCSSRSQAFAEGEAPSCPSPLFNFTAPDEECIKTVHKYLMNVIPRKVDFLPPYNGIRVSTEVFRVGVDSVQEALLKNYKQIHTSWTEYFQKQRERMGCEGEQTPEKVHKSMFTLEMIQFVSHIIVRATQDAELFNTLLSDLMLGNTQVDSQHCVFILQKLVFFVLNEMNQQKIYSQEFVDFVCDRVREGWFRNAIVPTLSLLFENMIDTGHPIPEIFICTLFMCYDIVPHEQFHILNEVTMKAWDLISMESGTTPAHFILLSGKAIDNQGYTEALCEKLSGVAQTQIDNWNFDGISLDSMSNMLQLASNKEQFNTWRFANAAEYQAFAEIVKSEEERMKEAISARLRISLGIVSQKRTDRCASFFIESDKWLSKLHLDIASSRTICSLIKVLQFDLFKFHLDFFIRAREKMLTSLERFSPRQKTVHTVTLLSDPLYPTRRIDQSPAVYNLPAFPSGVVEEARTDPVELNQMMPMWPSILQEMLGVPYREFEILGHMTENYMLTTFSAHFDLSPMARLATLQALLCGGGDFEVSMNAELMYGVEPIAGFFAKFNKSFAFIECVKNESGLTFTAPTIHDIIHNFYISYMSTGFLGIPSLFCGHCVVEWPRDEFIGCVKHHWLQQPVSIDVFTTSGWNFVLIADEEEFPKLFGIVNKECAKNMSEMPEETDVRSPINSVRLLGHSASSLAKQWAEGEIDNFTYLCLLNRLSSRSYADFSQYFVFPWVMSDFNNAKDITIPRRDLSLPMGQIGSERKKRFDAIFQESEDGYFYGTHYLHLGVVLYYMFRIDPFCLFSIYLHHGWDHPNRIFYDIKEGWMSAAHVSPADVKEMIPQLYCLPEAYVNMSGLNLGPKGDVNLGGYENSRDFTESMIETIQDDQTSSSLSGWIDLIFGYKSRGQASIDAKNKFHPLCYAKESTTTTATDEVTREAIRAYFVNFGQCPTQLFKKPHIEKAKSPSRLHLMSDPSLATFQRLRADPLWVSPKTIAVAGDRVAAVGRNRALLPPAFRYSIGVDQTDRTLVAFLDKERTERLVYNQDLMQPFEVVVSDDGLYTAIAHRELLVSLYKIQYDGQKPHSATFVTKFATPSVPSSVCISSCHFLIVALCGKIIVRYDLGTRRLLAPIHLEFEAAKIVIDDPAGLIYSVGEKIAVHTISGEFLGATEPTSPATAVISTALPEESANRFFVTGHRNGSVCFWNVRLHGPKLLVTLKTVSVATKAIDCISIDSKSLRCLFISNKELYEVGFIGSPAKALKTELGLECAECFAPLYPKARACSHCHRFVCDACCNIENPKVSDTIRKRYCTHCRAVLESNN